MLTRKNLEPSYDKTNEMGDKVLIVDDLPDNVFLLREVISLVGYKADSCKNGKEALEAFKNNAFKIIFMDLEMPVLNGFETMTEIRKNFDSPQCDVPIIAISAHPKYFFEEKDKLTGFTDYISKPYTLDKIKAILAKHNLLPQ